jgi:tripartite ATP-independent transporter DctM subunit
MDPSIFALMVVSGLIFLIFTGFPVVVALGLSSFLGIAHLMQDYNIAGALLASSAYGAIRSYVFATIPLFVLLGEIISRSGAATDLYRVIDTVMRRLPGRLALATVGGNTVFGAVTGVSIASAATFSRIAYPEMVRAHYNKSVALGSIAGSAALGMLIPPSILLIIWGVVASESIGRLFVAGIVPGILLASMFFLFLLTLALIKPKLFGEDSQSVLDKSKAAIANPITPKMIVGCFLVIALIMVILGGIWTGFFTPTEAGGVGVLFAVLVGLIKGMRVNDFVQTVLNTGRISALECSLRAALLMWLRGCFSVWVAISTRS